jgi:hypothetical protein
MSPSDATFYPAQGAAASRNGRSVAAQIWTFAPLLIALALRLASGPTANISYLMLAAYALCGPAHAIRALAFSWLFTMLSPGIAPWADQAAVGRYAVLFAAAASVMVRSGFSTSRFTVYRFTFLTIALGLFIIGHSVLISPLTDVSISRAVAWLLAIATLISAWLRLQDAQRQALSRELFWFLAVILVVSLPLAGTELGYLRNARGFQGILNHPQAFGPAMALLGAWAAARLFGERRPGWGLVGLTGACLAVVLMSEARTAGVAMVLGTALSVVAASIVSGRSIRHVAPGLRSKRVWGILLCAALASVAMAPEITQTVQRFVAKDRGAESVIDAYERSRGGLIDRMQENIAENPWTGIGFSIATAGPERMQVQRDPVLGLPVGAPIEKGVVPLMVVEELGIFGALWFALWVLVLLRGSARGGLAPFAVCLTVLLLNLGEATLFSPGGFGLISLILLGWAFSTSTKKEFPERA